MNSVAPGFVISSERLQGYWDRESPEAQREHLKTTFMRRAGRIDDIANAVLFLASDDVVPYGTSHRGQRRPAVIPELPIAASSP
jgi:NAD(P)-dependent dehydrogenase (short-subunit alcohol dehydrogenase family)